MPLLGADHHFADNNNAGGSASIALRLLLDKNATVNNKRMNCVNLDNCLSAGAARNSLPASSAGESLLVSLQDSTPREYSLNAANSLQSASGCYLFYIFKLCPILTFTTSFILKENDSVTDGAFSL